MGLLELDTDTVLKLAGLAVSVVLGLLTWQQKRQSGINQFLQTLLDAQRAELVRIRGTATEREEDFERVYSEVQQQHGQLIEQRARIENLEHVMRDWSVGIRLLIRQIKDLGHTPVWTPEEGEEAV